MIHNNVLLLQSRRQIKGLVNNLPGILYESGKQASYLLQFITILKLDSLIDITFIIVNFRLVQIAILVKVLVALQVVSR